jgi:hypothetical protein
LFGVSMKNSMSWSERFTAKSIDVGIDQAIVGPFTLVLGGVGGWVFSSPESTFAIKVFCAACVLLLLCFWLLCLFISFAADRIRLYWWSLGIFSGSGATYRQIHVLCEYVSRLRVLCHSRGADSADSVDAFGNVLWWFESNLRVLYTVYRVRGFDLAGGDVGMTDDEMTESCRSLMKCWVQVSRLMPSEPEGALECVAKYSTLSEGTRRVASECLAQVRRMRSKSVILADSVSS